MPGTSFDNVATLQWSQFPFTLGYTFWVSASDTLSSFVCSCWKATVCQDEKTLFQLFLCCSIILATLPFWGNKPTKLTKEINWISFDLTCLSKYFWNLLDVLRKLETNSFRPTEIDCLVNSNLKSKANLSSPLTWVQFVEDIHADIVFGWKKVHTVLNCQVDFYCLTFFLPHDYFLNVSVKYI